MNQFKTVLKLSGLSFIMGIAIMIEKGIAGDPSWTNHYSGVPNTFDLGCGDLMGHNGRAPEERINSMIHLSPELNTITFSFDLQKPLQMDVLQLVSTQERGYDIYETARYRLAVEKPYYEGTRPYVNAFLQIKGTDYQTRCYVGPIL